MSRSRTLSSQALAVVAVLASDDGWRHGYDITAQAGVKSGTLYPLLMRLEAQGLLEARWVESPAARAAAAPRLPIDRGGARLGGVAGGTLGGSAGPANTIARREGPPVRRLPYASALALVSRVLMHAAARLLGEPQTSWARAMRAELAAIGDEREALAFAWGCFCAALGHAFVLALARLARPHTAGVLACSTSVLLGCLFMHRAGAPHRYVWMNVLSLTLAVATFWLLPRQRLQHDGWLRAGLTFAMGALLLIASLGDGATGASAWLRVGPVRLNLPWLLLPALLVASDIGPQPAARRWAMGGLLMAFGALALQADALLAGLAAAVLGVRAWRRRSGVLALLAMAPLVTALHAGHAWQTADALPFVDRVLQRGFEQHLAIGLALALLQVLPLWTALRHRQAREHGLVWGLLSALAVPGWLPSPLVGFGGSFIFGYLLSLALLPGDTAEHPTTGPWPDMARRRRAPPPSPRSGLA